MQGRLRMPGDKSVSHRAVIIGALAEGVSDFDGFLASADTLAAVAACRRLGVEIQQEGERLSVSGVGLRGLSAPSGPLDLGNSGTAARLLMGALAGQDFDSVLTGDASLRQRPMARVAAPLDKMGADVRPASGGGMPVRIRGGRQLQGIEYALPVASAQLKSALLLAGLQARGKTALIEPAQTRDHTERLLARFACPVARTDRRLELEARPLRGTNLSIPGDISSAVFFLAAACVVPGSDLMLEGVGVNPTRVAVLEILRLMGADLDVVERPGERAEPVADIRVRHRPLRGVVIPPALVPGAIDEFPAILAAACCAQGETLLTDAMELRVKESDRIQALAQGFAALGVEARARPDGLLVRGARPGGGVVESNADHRIAMAFSLLGLAAEGPVTIRDCRNVNTSFPGFVEQARAVGWELAVEETEADAAAGEATRD